MAKHTPLVTLPSFLTARLALRGAVEFDLDGLWSLWAKAEVRRYLFDDVPVDRDRAVEVLQSCLALAPQGLGLWVVEFPARPGLIGCVGLLPTTTAAEYEPSLQGLVEPLAAFEPEVWGQGYAHEALCAIVTHAFSTLNLSTLAGVNDVPNEASHRMLLRLGFSVLGECDGPRYRLRTYALDRGNFEFLGSDP